MVHICNILLVGMILNLLQLNSSYAFNLYANVWQTTNSNFQPAFVSDDSIPPNNYVLTGKDIYFKAGHKKAHAYLLKAGKKTNKYVFVFHEWWGLNNYIKHEAQHLQADLGNVNVLVIDLYDGHIATTADSALAYMRLATDKRCRQIIDGAIKYAGKRAEIATLGWGLGGSWSLHAAIMCGVQAKACVMYYGMPESNAVKLKNICPVLGIFGNDDTRITPKIVDRFQTIMQQVNQTLVVYRYDAKADFANPYNTNHHVEATNQAYNQTISFIKKMLLQMPAH